MQRPLVLVGIIAWLVGAAVILQLGFTNNWSDLNLYLSIIIGLGIVTCAFAVISYKIKG